MSLTYAEIHQKKEWVIEQVSAALKEHFNQHTLSIAYGFTGNKGRGFEFAINLADLCHPGQKVGDDVVSFVAKKVQELVPGSRPEVQGRQLPRAH